MRLCGSRVSGRGRCWRVGMFERVVVHPEFGASRQAAPGRGSCCGGRCCASTALRCSLQGRAAELATFASLTALKQPRRVSQRSALRAPPSKLRSSPPQKSPLPGAARREVHGLSLPTARSFSKGAFGLGASLRGRRRGAQGAWPRAQRASTSDSSRCLSRVSAANVASFATGHATEHRRGVDAQHRPPRRSDAPSPNAPLPLRLNERRIN